MLIRKLGHASKKATLRKKDMEMRSLLCDYVLLLGYSGIRHGEEAFRIKWQ
ncbi:MAG: hypothetical protein AAGI72_01200 [Pseudomonadota bacterium]